MYLFYIDESGEIAYNSGSKYFVFNALGINANDWKSINHKVNKLKTAIFKTPAAPILEVKSDRIRFPREREKHEYLANLSEEELTQLSCGLMDIILNNNCTLTNIIENIMFVDLQYNNFIQLTDLCAYNVNKAFKDDHPDYTFFKRLLPKFAYSKKQVM